MGNRTPMKSCKFNQHINCAKQGPCNHCGWEPQEIERRNIAAEKLVLGEPSDGLIHLTIKKEAQPVGNSDIQPNTGAAVAADPVELPGAEGMAE